jgi:branched-chain amino acid transport system permease protein
MLTQVVQAVFTALSVGSMYALIAMGITLVYSATGIINFAQGEFVMLGGMVMVTLYGEMHWPLCLAVPIAIVAAVVVGMGLMKVAYRPGKSTSLISVFIIALGASLFISGSAGNVWDHSIHRYPPFSGEVPIQLLHATIMPQSLWIIGVTAALVLLLALYFRFTMLGKAMRACAIDRTAASLMGIKAKRMVLLSFMMSSGLGAVAGIVITPLLMTNTDVGMQLALKGFCAAMLGGMGSVVGGVLGGFVFSFLESFSATFIPGALKDVITFIVIIGVLLFMPSGLMGERNTEGLEEEEVFKE